MEHQQGDLTIKELANLYPKIRSNLNLNFQIIKGTPSYIAEDPINSRYYRIGVVEYKFISLLNGRRSVADAMRIITDSMAEEALDHHEVVQILHWLSSTNLLHTNKDQEIDDSYGLFGFSAGVSKIIFPRLPFGNPDRFLGYILPVFRFLLGKVFVVLWFGVVLFALYLVFSQWQRFVATTNSVLTLQNGVHLAIIWVLLKVIHELWHGLVCKYHGSEVRETGIIFILLLPLGYVDTSSSWNIPSKWKRIDIALAGMKIELLIAAIAAIIWSETSPSPLNQICYEIVLMAGITTIFFNANPLMRFDGYYVLADFMEEVNLYTRANTYLRYLGKRYILGVPASFLENSWRTRMFLFIYGLSAFFWKILIFVGIAIGASFLFLGIGIAIAIVYTITFTVIPLLRLLHYMFIGTKVERPPLVRSLIILAIIGYGLYATFYHITWRKGLEAPGVITYKNFVIERVYCPGFVKKIYVQMGDYVTKGQLLFQLDNSDILTEYKQLQIEIKQCEAKIRYYEQTDLVAAKIEYDKLLYFKNRAVQHKKLVDAMQVRASIDGYVATRSLPSLQNTFTTVGQELVTIFRPDEIELLVVISQEDIEQYQILMKQERLNVYIPSLEKTFNGKLKQITPRASRTIPHPALCAIGGGEIPVQRGTTAEENYQFVVPYFSAEISLIENNDKNFKYGQRGFIRIYQQEKNLGMLLYYELEQWFREIWKINNSM